MRDMPFDVAVVGAGPAGSTAARHSAMRGLRTLLLEKEKLPREKPCAGGLTAAAARELGFPLPERLIERRCRGMRLRFGHAENTATLDRDVADMVSRPLFDEFLADKAAEAGAELHEAETCILVEAASDQVIVSTDKARYSAKILIGADGYFSLAAREVRPPFSLGEVRVCVTAEIPLEAREVDERLGGIVEIDYGAIDRGYAWLFPKADRISAGIGGSYEAASRLKETFGRFLKDRGLPVPKRVQGCFIPVSRLTSPLGAGNILLTGDAAGLVDSFSGEGIRYALISGRLAADAAARSISRCGRGEGALESYGGACRRAFYGDLRASRLVTDFSFRHPGFFLEPAVSDRTLLLRYLETVTGEKSFRGYARWLAFRLPLLLARKAGGAIFK